MIFYAEDILRTVFASMCGEIILVFSHDVLEHLKEEKEKHLLKILVIWFIQCLLEQEPLTKKEGNKTS